MEALRSCLSQNADTESAYLCDPCVRQVFKLRREGETYPPYPPGNYLP